MRRAGELDDLVGRVGDVRVHRRVGLRGRQARDPQPRGGGEEEANLDDAFADFAERRFEADPTAATNVIEITRAFRRSARGASKYRSAEASVADVQIERLAKDGSASAAASSRRAEGVRLSDEPDGRAPFRRDDVSGAALSAV